MVKRFVYCTCLALLLAACDIAPQPAPTIASTAIPTQSVPVIPATTTLSATVLATATPQPSPTATAVPTVTPTNSPSPAPSSTATPTIRPSSTPQSTPTTQIFFPLPTRAPYVNQLIASPDNPALLFALTTQSHFARSDDGGVSWKPLPTEQTGATTISGIGIEYQNPKVLYFTSNRGIFKSLNQGQTWALVNPMSSTGITVDFSDANVLWTVVGTSSRLSAEIWRSSDGGLTWPSHSTGDFGLQSAGPILIDPHDPNTLFIVDDAGRLHRGTRDNVWTYITRPDPAYQGILRHGIAWSTNSNTLYVGSESPKLYATTNPKEPDPGQVVWKIVSEFGPDTGVRILAHSAPGETLYATVYTINSNLAKFVKSADSGKSWQELTMP